VSALVSSGRAGLAPESRWRQQDAERNRRMWRAKPEIPVPLLRCRQAGSSLAGVPKWTRVRRAPWKLGQSSRL